MQFDNRRNRRHEGFFSPSARLNYRFDCIRRRKEEIFMRARRLASEYLRSQGIVPGQPVRKTVYGLNRRLYGQNSIRRVNRYDCNDNDLPSGFDLNPKSRLINEDIPPGFDPNQNLEMENDSRVVEKLEDGDDLMKHERGNLREGNFVNMERDNRVVFDSRDQNDSPVSCESGEAREDLETLEKRVVEDLENGDGDVVNCRNNVAVMIVDNSENNNDNGLVELCRFQGVLKKPRTPRVGIKIGKVDETNQLSKEVSGVSEENNWKNEIGEEDVDNFSNFIRNVPKKPRSSICKRRRLDDNGRLDMLYEASMVIEEGDAVTNTLHDNQVNNNVNKLVDEGLSLQNNESKLNVEGDPVVKNAFKFDLNQVKDKVNKLVDEGLLLQNNESKLNVEGDPVAKNAFKFDLNQVDSNVNKLVDEGLSLQNNESNLNVEGDPLVKNAFKFDLNKVKNESKLNGEGDPVIKNAFMFDLNQVNDNVNKHVDEDSSLQSNESKLNVEGNPVVKIAFEFDLNLPPPHEGIAVDDDNEEAKVPSGGCGKVIPVIDLGDDSEVDSSSTPSCSDTDKLMLM